MVVVVTAVLVGVGGGGAETTCDSGSVAQPAKMPRMLQKAKSDGSRVTVRAEAEDVRWLRIVFFIDKEYSDG
jgi:hypothetical protein